MQKRTTTGAAMMPFAWTFMYAPGHFSAIYGHPFMAILRCFSVRHLGQLGHQPSPGITFLGWAPPWCTCHAV